MIIRQKERYFILIRSVTTDNPVMNFLTIVCDIVILHFLWLLTSLPVLTIGASTTALYYTHHEVYPKWTGWGDKDVLQEF